MVSGLMADDRLLVDASRPARNTHVENAAFSRLPARLDPDASTVLLDDPLGDCEPESETAVGRSMRAAETFEDDALVLLRNSQPVVHDGDVDRVGRRFDPDLDRSAVRRVTNGVREQVHQYLIDAIAIRHYWEVFRPANVDG